MSAIACFTGKMASGEVEAKAGERLLDAIDQAGGNAPKALDAKARARARDMMLAKKQVKAMLNVERAGAAYETVVNDLRSTKGDLGFGNKAPAGLGGTQSTFGRAAQSLLVPDRHNIATWGNAYSYAKAIRGEMHNALRESIEFLRPKYAGFKPETARELDVLNALWGRDASAEAKTLVESWGGRGGIADRLRQMLNEQGAGIPYREDWRISNPQADPVKVQSVLPNQFIDVLKRHFDVRDFETGELLTGERLLEVLRDVHQTMRTGGVEGAPSGGFTGAGALAKRRDHARVLEAKSPEAWLEFNEKFGTGEGVWETMMRHIDQASRDIGLMKAMGPNPAATMRFINAKFDREAARLAQPADVGNRKAVVAAIQSNQWREGLISYDRQLTQAMFDQITGNADVPGNAVMAGWFGNLRAALVSTQMGSAILSSLNDSMTLAATARFNGLDATKVLARATQMMGKPGAELRGPELGFAADTLAQAIRDGDRFMGETIRTGVAAKLASGVIRASGLRRWSAINRLAFGMEFSAKLARSLEDPFEKLTPAFRESLQRYGISSQDWAKLRDVAPYATQDGALFMRPMDVRRAKFEGAEDLGFRLDQMISSEMNYAVIEADPVARAIMLGSSRPGTIGGEARRAVGMYKTFPLAVMTLHINRALARGWDGSRLGHSSIMFIAMTLLGAVSMQTKEIAAGRDPLSLDPANAKGRLAWGKAVLQGGGLGVFGDVFFDDKTKFGNSWAAAIAGPQFAAAESLLGQFAIRNVQRALKGEETHFLGDAVFSFGRYVPGSNLWFARAAFQRNILDQLALMADERAPERFARIENEAQKKWGQSYFYAPGQTGLPARGPDLSRIGASP